VKAALQRACQRIAGMYQIRTFTTGVIGTANSVGGYALTRESRAFSDLRSGVSKPSLNQP
jgi:hypothetical protein